MGMPVAKPTDSHFHERLRALEATALARLFDLYFDPIYAWVCGRRRGRDAEQLTLGIFREIYQRLPQLAPGTSLERWIAGILADQAATITEP